MQSIRDFLLIECILVVTFASFDSKQEVHGHALV